MLSAYFWADLSIASCLSAREAAFTYIGSDILK